MYDDRHDRAWRSSLGLAVLGLGLLGFSCVGGFGPGGPSCGLVGVGLLALFAGGLRAAVLFGTAPAEGEEGLGAQPRWMRRPAEREIDTAPDPERPRAHCSRCGVAMKASYRFCPRCGLPAGQ